MKNFLSINDVKDLGALVGKALAFKQNSFQPKLKEGKSLALIFLNPSLRTRLSTIRAAQNLGVNPVVLEMNQSSWQLEFAEGVKMDADKPEHIKEAAAVIGSYFDAIAIRSFPSLKSQEEDEKEEVINAFLKYGGKPILNMESATNHPLQGLTDLMTIKENWQQKKRPRVVLTWAPHIKSLPHAVPNTFCEWMNAAEMDLTVVQPEGYELSKKYTGEAKVEYDQKQALQDADFVYVKNWSAYHDYGKVLKADESWRFSKEHLAVTNSAKVMHCLPVRRGVVINDEVLDSPNAIHLQQAQNRMFAAQAVLNELL